MDHLRHNVSVLRNRLPPGCRLMPVVKADAYGHGAVLIAGELNRLGIHAFCVATAGEGAELREHGIQGDILILGYTPPEDTALLVRYDLIQTIVDYQYAQALDKLGLPLRVHVGIDTGMHRLGQRCEEPDRICAIFSMKNLAVEGIFTHLCADNTTSPEDRSLTLAQADAFHQVVNQLSRRGIACPATHLLSSYGLLQYPALGGSYARVGIALYGVLESNGDAARFLGGPASGFIRTHPDCPDEAPPPRRVRRLRQSIFGQTGDENRRSVHRLCRRPAQGPVLRGGQRFDSRPPCAILGRICMDQTLVDISAIPEAAAGDTVTVLGSSGALSISACDIAASCGTIANEILSRLGPSLGTKGRRYRRLHPLARSGSFGVKPAPILLSLLPRRLPCRRVFYLQASIIWLPGKFSISLQMAPIAIGTERDILYCRKKKKQN